MPARGGEKAVGIVMKTFRKELWFNLPARRAFVNITAQVEAALAQSGVMEGLASVLCHGYKLGLIGSKRPSCKEPAAKTGRGPIEPMRRRRWGVCCQPCGAGAKRPWALSLVVNVCPHTRSSSLRAHNPLAHRQS